MNRKEAMLEHIREKIRQYAQQMGGVKPNGEPFTERDVEETLKRVLARIERGDIEDQKLKRSKAGLIYDSGRRTQPR